MKVAFTLIFLIVLLNSFGCSSVPRFTSNRNSPQKNDSETKHKTQYTTDVNASENEYNSYSNNTVLETAIGVASFYSDKYNGRITADGEVYNMYDLTAAHKTYPFGTIVKVTNILNKKNTIVRINDRLPDFNGRIIDLSYGTAEKLGMISSGITEVKLEVLKWGDNKYHKN